ERDPAYLSFAYVQVIASVADVASPPRRPLSALHIGAGGLTIPRYLAATRPGSVSRVLEIDGGVPALDRARLPQPVPVVEVDVGEAGVGLAQEQPGSRDLVVGDAFGGLAVPWHLTTREVTAQIARVLRPNGIYAINVIDFPPNAFVRAEVATIEAVFPNVALVGAPDALAGRAGGNFVAVASAGELPVASLSQRIAERGTPVKVAGRDATRRFATGSPVLL